MKGFSSSALLVLSLFILGAMNSCAARAQDSPVKSQPESRASSPMSTPRLVNRLAKCVVAQLDGVVRNRNLLLLDVGLNVTQAIGYCGCTSALMTWRVTGVVGASDRELAAGELNTLPRVGKPDKVYVVVSPDADFVKATDNVILSLSCSAPR